MKELLLVFILFLHTIGHTSRTKVKSRTRSRHKESLNMNIEDMEQMLAVAQQKSKIDIHKKRFTKDGRACATAFAFDGKVFNDCTDTMSPDNKNTGEEWCYVDANAGGNPNWGFCKPILDYDRVRKKTQAQFTKMTVEVRKVDNLIQEQIVPTVKLNNMVMDVHVKQLEADSKLNVIQNQIKKVNQNFQILTKIQQQYGELEKQIGMLKQEVEAMQEKKAQQSKDPRNCEGMLGYENEGPGTGVKAYYYDNEDFIGDHEEEKEEEEINFMWDNEQPSAAINQDNFSVKWKFWLRVPVSGKYFFYTESDDGNQLLLNGKPIIKHFWGQTGKTGGNWLKSHIGNLRKNIKVGQVDTNADAGLIQAQSFPTNLEGGFKYKLEYQMYHSVHNEEEDNGISFAKLYWSNDEIDKQIISQDFMYLKNNQPPIKISGLDTKITELGVFRNNDNAFAKSNKYKLQDLPVQFDGASMVRLVQEWPHDMFNFICNAAIVMYIAVPDDHNPLPDEFKSTDEYFSVVFINPLDKPAHQKHKGINSMKFVLYKKKFGLGPQKIKLTVQEGVKLQMIIMYTADPSSGPPLTCGGQEEQVSLPSGVDFEECKESSRFNENGYSCLQGFSGIMEDSEKSIWASKNENVGAWIELKLKQPYQFTKIEVLDRNNAVERNSKLEIFYDGGVSQIIKMKNVPNTQTFKLDAVISKTVKIVIKGIYAAMNNGGAFNLFATQCVDPAKLEDDAPAEGAVVSKGETKGNCEDTLLSNSFVALGLRDGTTAELECPETCEEAKGPVYGDIKYSEDSIVCKAAAHMGVINKDNKKCILKVEGAEGEYKGAFKNGIQSKKKMGGSMVSMTFEKLGGGGDISETLVVGMKIDLFGDGTQKWMPGVIKEMERKDAKSAKLVIRIENMPDSTIETVVWPNEAKLAFCGAKMSGRDCAGGEGGAAGGAAGGAGGGGKKLIKVAFCFSEPPQGYLHDRGETFSDKNGESYGWQLDATKNVRKRVDGEGVENQLALFPPDQKSKFCKEDPPRASCAYNEWKIKVKKGVYSVKLVYGDKKFKIQYDLSVNDLIFVSGKILKEDQFMTEVKEVKVSDSDPFLKLSGKCMADNCDNSWSRISAIEIQELPEEQASKDKEGEGEAGCGVAFYKGKCSKEGENIENCIYDIDDNAANNCMGLLALVKVKSDYVCKDQRGKFKCIKKVFKDADQCKEMCPGDCKGEKCHTD